MDINSFKLTIDKEHPDNPVKHIKLLSNYFRVNDNMKANIYAAFGREHK